MIIGFSSSCAALHSLISRVLISYSDVRAAYSNRFRPLPGVQAFEVGT